MISRADSRVSVAIVFTNEELVVARESVKVLRQVTRALTVMDIIRRQHAVLVVIDMQERLLGAFSGGAAPGGH